MSTTPAPNAYPRWIPVAYLNNFSALMKSEWGKRYTRYVDRLYISATLVMIDLLLGLLLYGFGFGGLAIDRTGSELVSLPLTWIATYALFLWVVARTTISGFLFKSWWKALVSIPVAIASLAAAFAILPSTAEIAASEFLRGFLLLLFTTLLLYTFAPFVRALSPEPPEAS